MRLYGLKKGIPEDTGTDMRFFYVYNAFLKK